MKMKKLSNFLLFSLVLLSVASSQVRSLTLTPSLNDDVLGLIVFKADIQDPTQKLSSWDEDDNNPCNWNGVKCNPRLNRVTELNLNGFSLSGRIGRGLLQLKFLRKLSLAKNNLTGTMSPNLVKLESLRIIDLSENSLSGFIPDDFFEQCGSLKSVSLADNMFSGKIPVSLGSCAAVASIDLSGNRFLGSLPVGIWGLSGLRSLDLSGNMLEGEIPKGVQALNNLRSINLSKNKFSGQVPDEIGSCLLLRSIDFSRNSFSGSVPRTMQKLSLCSYLNLSSNSFSGEVPEWLGEMGSLETLDLSVNNFSGQVPDSIGKLKSLKVLNFSANGFNGSLPASMENNVNLLALDFSQNLMTGELPRWIFDSENKVGADVDNASSTSLGTCLQRIQVLDLSRNLFSGGLCLDTGALSSLKLLNLSRNSLVGPIPGTIGELTALDVLDLSRNQLNGSIPTEIGGAYSLKDLRLDANILIGKIPTSLENCTLLRTLIISHNKLSGPIPSEIGKLSNLETVDLSFNSLSGTLPKQLANLPRLLSFNISHNNLQGELPAGIFFNTISPTAVSGNPLLCGSAVNKSCPAVLPKPIVLNPNTTADSISGELPPNVGHKRIVLSISALIAIGAAAFIVVGVIAITVLNLRVKSSTPRSAAPLTFSAGEEFSRSPTTDANSGKLVMFSGEPDFSTGAHALLNKDCELGRGGFGAVYRTVLQDGRSVAIKKLTVSSLVKSQEEFEREVKKLGKISHPNLVALEGYYWTPSLQLLISEFVSGGSLHKHLHEGPSGNHLSWHDRFRIILGTAKSLAHLHRSNIIHYNIKSSNVLIDGSGEPKLGDFGLARLLPMLDRYVLSSKIQSALGYMAPEFACRTVKITEKCDVYGFGVLMMEVVTGKRPVEYMEDDVVVLCDMVREALEEGRVEECVDGKLQGKFPVEEVIPVMKLGLICTSQVPSNRPDMEEVIKILELIRCPSEGQEDSG
ncbi:Leucine-rich repeat receptor-like protein kinase PXC2 [Hibiscus syriacus]|uniref:Leucine-rich repeat receptor-like protein kinase PXC2 n=1 Tax=Hibiscus syriacus TaxID=106335 RepID=A0A6A3C529_HIBSY|nr:probable LRR receptor-like serine/threonine-protein kinase IRK [Hibiscus syriacus]KAE8724300.1 Leucine-rich repeat receptor-like protein kinase PXC2 [Hibiscus syriacus]